MYGTKPDAPDALAVRSGRFSRRRIVPAEAIEEIDGASGVIELRVERAASFVETLNHLRKCSLESGELVGRHRPLLDTPLLGRIAVAGGFSAVAALFLVLNHDGVIRKASE